MVNDDLINRQAAIEALNADGITKNMRAHRRILSLPSAERRGRWKDHSDEWEGGYYECSVCGEAFTFIEGTPKENLYNYCPYCGARMEAE